MQALIVIDMQKGMARSVCTGWRCRISTANTPPSSTPPRCWRPCALEAAAKTVLRASYQPATKPRQLVSFCSNDIAACAGDVDGSTTVR